MADAQSRQRSDKVAEQEADRLEKAAAAEDDLKATLAIAEAKARGDSESAARIKNEADIAREQQSLRERGVTDEDSLNQLATSRRNSLEEILDAKREERKVEIELAEAKARGNKEEETKLQRIKDYIALQSKGYSEDEARRVANAKSVESPGKPTAPTDPGDILNGTRRRRGILESDASFEDVPLGQSKLDQYKKNQSRPVGSINGMSILGADPTSSAKGGQQDSSASGVNAAAEAIESSGDNSAEAITGLQSAIETLASAVKNKANKENDNARQIKNLDSKIMALAQQI